VRHILFLVNWVAYKRRQRPAVARPLYAARCLAAFAGAAYDRARSAGNVARADRDGANGSAANTTKSGNVSKDGFTASGAGAIAKDFSVRRFVARCLEENERRFAAYDPRLLRPRVVPALARAYLTLTGFQIRSRLGSSGDRACGGGPQRRARPASRAARGRGGPTGGRPC
jgi:hypothetical protein